jgi:hypothetical protein
MPAPYSFTRRTDGVGNPVFAAHINELQEAIEDIGGGVLTAGTGITAGVGTVYESSAMLQGSIYITTILADLTGLNSSVTNDIIGVNAAANCHFGQYQAAISGATILAGRMTCLEVPAGGDVDIDLWSADEATLAEDTQISAATGELNLIASAGNWTLNRSLAFTTMPGVDDYFYLTSGGAGVSATYTAGKFLIEMWGYD